MTQNNAAALLDAPGPHQAQIDSEIERLETLLHAFRGATAMPIGQARIQHWNKVRADLIQEYQGAPVAAQTIPAAIAQVPA